MGILFFILLFAHVVKYITDILNETFLCFYYDPILISINYYLKLDQSYLLAFRLLWTNYSNKVYLISGFMGTRSGF